MSLIDVPALLADLTLLRPVFHSEADFQHALAWRLHEAHPALAVRLEYRPPLPNARVYVDVWATDGHGVLALELKYKTRRLQVTVNGEPFDRLRHLGRTASGGRRHDRSECRWV